MSVMNRELAVKMEKEVMEAVKAIAEKYGYDVKRGGASFKEESLKVNNITFYKKGEVGGRVSTDEERKLKVEFDINKRLNGLSHANVGDTYYSVKHNSDMEIVGWKSKNRKYPVLVKNVRTGDLYKMSPSALAMNLERGE